MVLRIRPAFVLIAALALAAAAAGCGSSARGDELVVTYYYLPG